VEHSSGRGRLSIVNEYVVGRSAVVFRLGIQIGIGLAEAIHFESVDGC
jgi:hypothetical protein